MSNRSGTGSPFTYGATTPTSRERCTPARSGRWADLLLRTRSLPSAQHRCEHSHADGSLPRAQSQASFRHGLFHIRVLRRKGARMGGRKGSPPAHRELVRQSRISPLRGRHRQAQGYESVRKAGAGSSPYPRCPFPGRKSRPRAEGYPFWTRIDRRSGLLLCAVLLRGLAGRFHEADDERLDFGSTARARE
jgi:hypothetical protein